MPPQTAPRKPSPETQLNTVYGKVGYPVQAPLGTTYANAVALGQEQG
jgi:hypothetical protein